MTGELFIRFVLQAVNRFRPDVAITYGGYWTAPPILDAIRSVGSKSVFLLQNFAYEEKRLFDKVDLTITPSEYAARGYHERLGIETTPLPPIIRMEEIAPSNERNHFHRQYALYVNPSLNKGVFLFSRIARDLAVVRPDIPLLVVEGCSTAKDLLATSANARSTKNVCVMGNVSKPRDFYQRAKLTLAPSFFEESFGRVAAESMLCGIPVIGSDRGALPETLGAAGKLVNIPSAYTPQTKSLPTSEEVKPWIEEIVKQWDDEEYYARRRQDSLRRAAAWDYSKVADRYENILRTLAFGKSPFSL